MQELTAQLEELKKKKSELDNILGQKHEELVKMRVKISTQQTLESQLNANKDKLIELYEEDKESFEKYKIKIQDMKE